jgi:hypothetical protein
VITVNPFTTPGFFWSMTLVPFPGTGADWPRRRTVPIGTYRELATGRDSVAHPGFNTS